MMVDGWSRFADALAGKCHLAGTLFSLFEGESFPTGSTMTDVPNRAQATKRNKFSSAWQSRSRDLGR